jgi:hypothetical protein
VAGDVRIGSPPGTAQHGAGRNSHLGTTRVVIGTGTRLLPASLHPPRSIVSPVNLHVVSTVSGGSPRKR